MAKRTKPLYLGNAEFIPVDHRGGKFKRSKSKLNTKQRANRRAARQKVKAAKVYSSLWQAWRAFGLPTSHHQSFRKRLKEDGKLTYEIAGETYYFEIIR